MKGQDLRDILGKNIRLLRFHNNLSQAELAEKAGISINFLSELERGHKWPRAETLAGISGALNIPIAELFQSEGDVSDKSKEIMARFSGDLSRMVSQAIETVCRQYRV